MPINTLLRCSVLAAAAILAACAAAPAETPAPAAAPVAAAKPVAPVPAAAAKSAATPETVSENQAASALEKKFQEAARSYRMVERDGKTLYCKKEKPINSTIPRTICLTESELRVEVEQMDEMRQRMRNQGRCTTGAGCGAGG